MQVNDSLTLRPSCTHWVNFEIHEGGVGMGGVGWGRVWMMEIAENWWNGIWQTAKNNPNSQFSYILYIMTMYLKLPNKNYHQKKKKMIIMKISSNKSKAFTWYLGIWCRGEGGDGWQFVIERAQFSDLRNLVALMTFKATRYLFGTRYQNKDYFVSPLKESSFQ